MTARQPREISSPPLGQCGRQIKAAAAVLRRCPKKITCSGFDRRGLPPGTSTVLPPCRLLTHRCRLGATHFCSRSEGKRTSGQHHATSQFDPCATSARRSQVTSAAQLPTSNTQVSPGTFKRYDVSPQSTFREVSHFAQSHSPTDRIDTSSRATTSRFEEQNVLTGI